MKQSRIWSAVESLANIGSGFGIALLIWIFVVEPLYTAGYTNPILVTGIFTVVSIIRSYVWRRIFNYLHWRKHVSSNEMARPQSLVDAETSRQVMEADKENRARAQSATKAAASAVQCQRSEAPALDELATNQMATGRLSQKRRPVSADAETNEKECRMSAINPKHYRSHPSGLQAIDVTRWFNFNIGNAIKYLWRCGMKDAAPQELTKAIWYIQDERARITGNLDSSPAGAPKVVCLCGSTKFKEQFLKMDATLTLGGEIVLKPGRFTHAEEGDHAEKVLGEEAKRRLDQLHFRKIDLADYVYVINVGGYIGSSTANEIAYAKKTGKPIMYLEGVRDDVW